ncbi:hypothetical protein C8R45DRAFT_574271 [Mycena sanguinolenta]|nr:hypothetical protein C8R45DRAFT_574271 [Mycena sanguinolenta]
MALDKQAAGQRFAYRQLVLVCGRSALVLCVAPSYCIAFLASTSHAGCSQCRPLSPLILCGALGRIGTLERVGGATPQVDRDGNRGSCDAVYGSDEDGISGSVRLSATTNARRLAIDFVSTARTNPMSANAPRSIRGCFGAPSSSLPDAWSNQEFGRHRRFTESDRWRALPVSSFSGVRGSCSVINDALTHISTTRVSATRPCFGP